MIECVIENADLVQ